MHFRASWNQVIGRFLVSRVNSRRSQTTVRYCSFTAIGVSDNSIVGIRSDRPARLRPLEGRTCSARAVLKIQYPILQWAASEQTSQMMIASGTSRNAREVFHWLRCITKTSKNVKLAKEQIPIEKFPFPLYGAQVSPHSKLRHCSVHTANSHADYTPK